MPDREQTDPTEPTHAEDFQGLESPEPGPGRPPDPEDTLTKKSQWSNWTVLALIVLCFFVIVRFRPLDIFRPTPKGIGGSLSRLSLQPLTDTDRSITLDDLTGRVVLLNFWGTWCPPCRQEFPHLADIYHKFRNQTAFKLLSVSCGRGTSEDMAVLRQTTEEFLRQADIRMPTYADPDQISRGAVDEIVGFQGYPTTLLIDRRGAIRRVWVGFRPGYETEMSQQIKKLLAEG